MKKLIKLTEQDLHKIVKESAQKVIQEMDTSYLTIDTDRLNQLIDNPSSVTGYHRWQLDQCMQEEASSVMMHLQHVLPELKLCKESVYMLARFYNNIGYKNNFKETYENMLKLYSQIANIEYRKDRVWAT